MDRLNPVWKMSKWCVLDKEKTSAVDIQGRPKHQWRRRQQVKEYLANIIEQYDPAGFIIASGSEADIKCLYSAAISELETWCNKTGRKIYAFTSCKQNVYDYPDYVIYVNCQTYDTINYHTVLSYFCPLQSDETLKPIGDDYSPDLLFTCYNNRPDYYRSYIVNSLFGKNLQDLGIITYRQFTVECPKETDWQPEYWEEIGNVPYLMPLKDPHPAEHEFKLNSGWNFRPNSLPYSYHRGLIDIVTESVIEKDELYMSEKTCKPLFAHKPFLVVGAPGYHHWLNEEKNLELYDELFDYSFDDEPDYKKRIDGIIDNIERLSTIYKSPEDYKQLWNSVKAKTQRNFFRYMATIRSGLPFESIMHHIGINSPDPLAYTEQKLDDILTPDHLDHSGSELHWVLEFFNEVVVPYRNNSLYIGKDLWDRYQNFFSVDESLEEIWGSDNVTWASLTAKRNWIRGSGK